MNVVTVPEKREEEMFREFTMNSVLTFEGIDISSKEGRKQLEKFEELMRSTGYDEKDCIAYKFTGESMNRVFELTGSNAYSNGLTFIAIPGYHNPVVKQCSGARWFDDIVASNSIKENGVRFNHEPDYR